MGVSLALKKLDQAIARETSGRVVTLGPIIHNPQVIADYKNQGVVQVGDIAELKAGDHVLIRAHGIPRQVEEALRGLGVDIVDATCPKVKKAQKNIAEMSADGNRLLLFGEPEHPEVRGLLSYSDAPSLLFSNLEEVDGLCLNPDGNYFLAAQTTQDQENFFRAAEILKARLRKPLLVMNTICDATRKRLAEARALSQEVEAMVVVGGLSSGNTRRLAAVAEEQGIKTWHVETPDMLPIEELRGLRSVGLSAGASTPKALIDATQNMLHIL